jgi:hypothetical protein
MPEFLGGCFFHLPVKSLGGFTETTGKTIVDQGTTEDFLESFLDRHLALGGIGGNLDFLGINGHMFFLSRHFLMCRKKLLSMDMFTRHFGSFIQSIHPYR